LLDANEGLDIVEEYPQVKKWYLIGHSLGGSAASTIIEQHSKIKGIIFLASYPIVSIDVPSLTVYGGQDGVLPIADIEKSKQNVRKDAVFHEIKQGNHANFGMYGPQKGDNRSPLTSKEQQDEALDEIKQFIDMPSSIL
jgi:pimeloyl-ACP methyl ester carboxylesterase